MGMKLLSPVARKDKEQEEITRKILRIQEVEDMTKKVNAQLSRAQADFSDVLARNKEKWAIEEEEHLNRVKDMQKEVEALENRKKQALIPIQMYKKEADKMLEEAQEILKKAQEKEENADFLTEKLEEKLTELGDREKNIIKEEQRIEIAKEGIKTQQEATRDGIKRLSEEMVKFHEKQESDQANIDERKKEVALAEINLNAKLDKYARDLEALKIFEAQLKDERATLDREYSRKK